MIHEFVDSKFPSVSKSSIDNVSINLWKNALELIFKTCTCVHIAKL
jgi:hypothetical protein